MTTAVISERENADRVFGRAQGDPLWIPIVGIYNDLVFSSALHERPAPPEGKDWAGCNWVWDETCLGFAPNLHMPMVLEDICDWREVVPFPDLDAIDWAAAAEKDLAEHDHENKYLCMFMETGPWERVHALMGMEQAFVALYEEPDEVKALLEAITDYKIAAIDKLGEYYHPDQYFFQDDLGTASGPMMSLEMYREFLKPCHRRVAEAIHAQGALYIHHSCGWMDAFIDDLIDVGVDSINPLQAMNDWEGVAKRYGDVLHFDVGVPGTDSTRNTEADERATDHRIIDTFGPTKHLTTMNFPTNAATMNLVDAAMDELITYSHQYYAN